MLIFMFALGWFLACRDYRWAAVAALGLAFTADYAQAAANLHWLLGLRV